MDDRSMDDRSKLFRCCSYWSLSDRRLTDQRCFAAATAISVYWYNCFAAAAAAAAAISVYWSKSSVPLLLLLLLIDLLLLLLMLELWGLAIDRWLIIPLLLSATRNECFAAAAAMSVYWSNSSVPLLMLMLLLLLLTDPLLLLLLVHSSPRWNDFETILH